MDDRDSLFWWVGNRLPPTAAQPAVFCGCGVVLIDPGGIPDTDESVSGALYEITRTEGYVQLYAHIEVYFENLPVLPALLSSICLQLDLPLHKVLGKRQN